MRTPDASRLDVDLAWCRDVLRRGSQSFWTAGQLLPPDVRDAFAAVYAFCRAADDLVDLAPTVNAGVLARITSRIDRVYAAREPLGPGDYALGCMVERYDIPRTVFDALVEGFAWEVDGRHYETIHDLYAYSTRVASCVGAAAALIMGRRDPVTLARACDLGVAMQLTNIARDVGEDARRGRLYLPREWMRDEGLDPDAFLAAPAFSPALGRVVRRLLGEAEVFYARADEGIDRLPERCRPAIRAARLVYADIGRVIARHGFDAVGRRAWTSAPRKAWMLLRAVTSRGESARTASAAPPLREARFLVDAALLGGRTLRPKGAAPWRLLPQRSHG